MTEKELEVASELLKVLDTSAKWGGGEGMSSAEMIRAVRALEAFAKIMAESKKKEQAPSPVKEESSDGKKKELPETKKEKEK
jgi:hypothetical protein